MSLVGTRPPTVTEASEYYIYPVVNAQNAMYISTSNHEGMENLFYLFIDQEVKKPKALGDIRGASYIYPILWRFSLIRVSEVIEKKMGKQR